MLARFFIDRPIFAWVISIVIVLAGLIAYLILPIAQYPNITPPTVQVTCNFPGANSQVVADTVAAPIEQQVNGVENMLYMSSTSANDGTYTLVVTFELGTDLNMAQVLVQNRVSQALPKLPSEVQNTGVTVKKQSPAILLVVNLYSEDNQVTGKPYHEQLDLSNYATIQVKDELARLKGVGDISLLGQQDYSMRVWLDPERLAKLDLTAGEVISALREQNVQVAAGQIGQQPVPKGQDFQYSMSTLGRLLEEQQFADIIIKTGNDGRITRLKDVTGDPTLKNKKASIELGAQSMNTRCRLDGKPSVGLAVFQLPGSNALQTGDRIKKRMKELAPSFPEGMKYTIVYDTTPFIEESVHEVLKTLGEAIVLVVIVVLFFLQDWKAVILPTIDVIVSLVGTLAVMLVMGFSLNNLTLFGLVLAIGIVVDDAIVVLENIERWIAKGLKVRDATIHAMAEITGPIIAITLVLSSVFLPSAFLGGITGQFYRQFALTISVSMLISAINAMTMTPARAGSIFKDPKPGEHAHHAKEALPWWIFGVPGGMLTNWLLGQAFGEALGLPTGEHAEKAASLAEGLRRGAVNVALFLPGAVVGAGIGYVIIRPVNYVLGVFFRGFNWIFDRITDAYGMLIGRLVRLSFMVLFVYVGLLALTGWSFTQVPTGFIPMQDQGYLVVDMQLPDSASLERTVELTEKIEKIARETEGVAHTVAVPGQTFVLNAISSNYGGMFIVLKPFHERLHGPSADEVMTQIRRRVKREIQEGRVSVFGAPPIQGLGNTGGYKLMVEDRSDQGYAQLQGQADALAERANKQPGLVGVFNTFRASTPQLYVDVDRTKCKTLGVQLSDVFQTLQVFLGGYYVNDFNKFGRTWQVNVQAEASYRLTPDKIKLFQVRNRDGQMVPLGSLLRVIDSSGPVIVNRYNLYPAAAINAGSKPGVASGTAMEELEEVAKKLPRGMKSEWTELSYLQKQSMQVESFQDLMQNPMTAFVGAVVLVFLVLAAQYESWSLPFSIILVVPMCLLCAVTGIAIARMDLNIFVQIGFIVLVGLACKNAILIVQFAQDLRREEGLSIYAAAVKACTVRLRPIVMTSFAFILGVYPLVVGTGAGAEMRRTLGTAVFSGMIGVTFFGLILTPVFYYVVERYLVGEHATAAKPPAPEPALGNGAAALVTPPPATSIEAHDKPVGS